MPRSEANASWAARRPDDVRSLVVSSRPHRRRWLRSASPYLAGADFLAAGLAATLLLGPAWHEIAPLAVAVLVTMAARGAHRSRLTVSALDDVPAIAFASIVGMVVHGFYLLMVHDDVTVTLVTLAAALGASLVVFRAGAYFVMRQARKRGLVDHRALVLGAGRVGRQVAQASLDHPEFGIRPVGFLDAGPISDGDDLPAPLLGNYKRLAQFVRRENVSVVFVAFLSDDAAEHQDADLIDVVRQCDRMDIEIFSVPRLHELRHLSHDMDELWGIPLVRARRSTWRSSAWVVKRVLDVIFSAVALVLLSPLMLVAALAVRMELGPGVLFRQVRVGLDGDPFTLLKFRSLRLPESGPGATPWSISNDARLGRVGRFLRTTSVDELPQLLNVIRGEMSLVGPRPERPEFVAEFADAIPTYTARHRAPAGLTGLAQVNGLRGDTSITDRARFDNYYIQNWSLWLDTKILVRTVSTVLLRRGS